MCLHIQHKPTAKKSSKAKFIIRLNAGMSRNLKNNNAVMFAEKKVTEEPSEHDNEPVLVLSTN